MPRNDICPRCRRIVDLRDDAVWDNEKALWVHGICQQLILERRIEDAQKKARKGTLTIEEATQRKDDEMELLGLRESAKHQSNTMTREIRESLGGIFLPKEFDGKKLMIHAGETLKKDMSTDSSTKIFSKKDPRYVDITLLRKTDQKLIEQERARSRKKIEEGIKRWALKDPGILKAIGYPDEDILALIGEEKVKMLPVSATEERQIPLHTPSLYSRYARGEITYEEMKALEGPNNEEIKALEGPHD
jgi:hypothetical protein